MHYTSITACDTIYLESKLSVWGRKIKKEKWSLVGSLKESRVFSGLGGFDIYVMVLDHKLLCEEEVAEEDI